MCRQAQVSPSLEASSPGLGALTQVPVISAAALPALPACITRVRHNRSTQIKLADGMLAKVQRPSLLLRVGDRKREREKKNRKEGQKERRKERNCPPHHASEDFLGIATK